MIKLNESYKEGVNTQISYLTSYSKYFTPSMEGVYSVIIDNLNDFNDVGLITFYSEKLNLLGIQISDIADPENSKIFTVKFTAPVNYKLTQLQNIAKSWVIKLSEYQYSSYSELSEITTQIYQSTVSKLQGQYTTSIQYGDLLDYVHDKQLIDPQDQKAYYDSDPVPTFYN